MLRMLIWYLNFFLNFLNKTNKNINLKLLIQDTGVTDNNLIETSNKILHELYNFKINDKKANKDIIDR